MDALVPAMGQLQQDIRPGNTPGVPDQGSPSVLAAAATLTKRERRDFRCNQRAGQEEGLQLTSAVLGCRSFGCPVLLSLGLPNGLPSNDN